MLSLYIFYNIFDSLIFCVDLTESAGTKDRIGSSVRPGPDQQQPIRAEQRRPRDGQKDQEFKEGEENNVVFPFVGYGAVEWRGGPDSVACLCVSETQSHRGAEGAAGIWKSPAEEPGEL